MEEKLKEIEAEDDMMIFDPPSKSSSKTKVDKIKEEATMELSISQQIEECEDFDTMEFPNSKELSASQIIEDPDKSEVAESTNVEDVRSLTIF